MLVLLVAVSLINGNLHDKYLRASRNNDSLQGSFWSVFLPITWNIGTQLLLLPSWPSGGNAGPPNDLIRRISIYTIAQLFLIDDLARSSSIFGHHRSIA